MKKSYKVFWTVVAALVGVGTILTGVGLLIGARTHVNWNKTGLHAVDSVYETLTEPELPAFTSVEVRASIADIIFVQESGSDRGLTIHYEKNYAEPTWTVENGVLIVDMNDKERGWQIINFDFGFLTGDYLNKQKITICLPRGIELDKVDIHAKDGDIEMGSFTAKDLRVESSYGHVNLSEIVGDNLAMKLSSGNVKLKNVQIKETTMENRYGNIVAEDVSGESMKMDFSSGNIKMKNVQMGETTIENRYGNLTAENMTGKSFVADMSSGDMNFDDCKLERIDIKNAYGNIAGKRLGVQDIDINAKSGDVRLEGDIEGNLALDCSYGNIIIETTAPKANFTGTIATRYGNVMVDGKSYHDSMELENEEAPNKMKIKTSSGNIKISFEGKW